MNPDEPKPDLSQPAPPTHLSPDARVEWDRVVDALHRLGVLTEIDRGALAACCQAYGRWVQAERALAKMAERDPATHAMMIRTQSGNAIRNTLVGAANKAMSDMMRYAAEFGMTSSARTRINAEGGKDTSGLAARYFG